MLPEIAIRMAADLSRLSKDMAQAKGMVGDAGSKMTGAFSGAQKALAGLGVGLSVAGFASWVKGAINAADETSKLSARTGLATKEVAGMQLAFELSGLEAGDFAKAMTKVATEVSDGNKAFEVMGIKTKNADGSLRGTRAVLGDLADSFAGMEDGTRKTALAVEVFGDKLGSKMIPLLNGGSEGLAAMDEMAGKLGLTIDGDTAQAAERFNDTLSLIGKGGTGIATQIAAKLLPTLESLAGGFLEAMTEGDRLSQISDAISAGLKGVYSVAVGAIGGITAFGKALGGVIAAADLLAQGEFKKALGALKESWTDAGDAITATGKEIEKVWKSTGSETVKTAVTVTKAQREITSSGKDLEKQQKASADAAKKHADEMKKQHEAGLQLVKAIEEQLAVTKKELALGRELTDAEKAQLNLTKELASGKKTLTAEEEANARAMIETNYELRQLIAARKEEAAVMSAVAAHSQKMTDAQWEEVAALQKGNAEIAAQNAVLGMNSREIQDREIAMLNAKATTLDWQAAEEGGNDALRAQAELLRKRAGLMQEGIVVQEAQAARAAWDDVTKSIGQGLTDSLFRAFEAGKGFFTTLWDGIKNTFKTTVLKLAINAVMNPINAGIGGLLGVAGGSANASGGALGSGVSLLNSLSGIGSAAAGFGGGLLGGANALFQGLGLEALGGAGAAIGNGSIAAGLGIGAGVALPVAGLAYGLYSLLKKPSTPHTGGAALADANDAVAAAWDSLGPGSVQVSGDMQGAVGLTAHEIAKVLQSLSNVGSGGKIQVGAGFADDSSKDGAWGGLRITSDGNKLVDWQDTRTSKWAPKVFADGAAGMSEWTKELAASTRDAIDKLGLPDWAMKMIEKAGETPTLESLAKLAQEITDKQAADMAAAKPVTEAVQALASQQLDIDTHASLQLDAVNASVLGIGDRITAAVESLRASLEAGLAASTAATQRTNRLLTSWDDGGSLVTTTAP